MACGAQKRADHTINHDASVVSWFRSLDSILLVLPSAIWQLAPHEADRSTVHKNSICNRCLDHKIYIYIYLSMNKAKPMLLSQSNPKGPCL